ncbi:uncharacterized protein EDB91DRAFT_1118646 [Suillus paluster]|uniref:uncharacterized protein n=1 Tax=Suillus paluster TaxID=48578 RepID=UPI001B873D24|nr:uncharacterized protein EDB91DRAFT_1118646 [Suillus paluster]KAG1746747.1 hypothetical protein EDB91DRAFT_1118646 [Suillus paluster]
MQRNRVSNYQKQSSPAMSPSLIHSAGAAVSCLPPDDEDDNDICPVCDGDCTCDNKPRPPPAPIAGNGLARPVATSSVSSTSTAHVPVMPSLKIKFTVPASMQNRARILASQSKKSRADGASSSNITGSGAASTSGQAQYPASSSTAGHGHYISQDSTNQKHKGRPSIGIVDVRGPSRTAAADRQIRGNEANTLPQSHLPSPRAHKQGALKGPRSDIRSANQPRSNLKSSRPPQKSKAQGTSPKKVSGSKKKKKQALLSDGSTSDHADQSTDDLNDDNDTESGQFPTFVAASDLSPSSASDSSDSCSESSSFDSDSSLEAEEESYILAEQRRHDKARVRRELLGDDSHRRKDAHNNNWVIRPRKKSVGLSDVDMDGESDDLTEDEDEEEEEEDKCDEEEDEETDGQAPSVIYTGLATGWSDDEESSFDADIFFANLSDTNTDDSSSEDEPADPQADDVMASSISSLQRSTNLEMTEGWDGQIVFTNGCDDGQGVLDLAFEATAAQLLASDTASISQDSDVEMGAEMGIGGEDDDDDEVDSVIGTSDGETTEEELVDASGLPTSRAMRLFRWPTTVSSINPMSTVSPTVSPAPHNRRSTTSRHRDSPRPADILAMKIFCDDSDHSQADSGEGSAPSPIRRITRGGVPIMGHFEHAGDDTQKTAILTGSNKDVPSPFPRLAHRHRRIDSSSGGSFSSMMDIRGRTSRLTIFTPSSVLPPPSSSDEPSLQTTPEPSLAEPIELDDVLDSSYLDSEPEMSLGTGTGSEGELHRHLQSLSRWDRVPVGTFRFTRESAASSSEIPSSPGWASEPPKTASSDVLSYSNVMKSSPLSTMLWHDKEPPAKATPRKNRSVVISPVLLPVRDGDRTPTHVPHNHDQPPRNDQQPPHKTRKESRREMKMLKRKTHGPIHHHHYHHQYHHHNHHPNMKSRSTGSVQRTNFFSSPTSIPPLNI